MRVRNKTPPICESIKPLWANFGKQNWRCGMIRTYELKRKNKR